MITTVDQLVERLGGTSKAAEFFAVSAPAVSNWKNSGRLPAWVMPRVIAWAAEEGDVLSDDLTETIRPPGSKGRSKTSEAAE
jgi:DNA-binding transcriptional regulator YdaS (Cro superfamily)